MPKYICISCPEWTRTLKTRKGLWVELPKGMGKNGAHNPAMCPKCTFMVLARVAQTFVPEPKP